MTSKAGLGGDNDYVRTFCLTLSTLTHRSSRTSAAQLTCYTVDDGDMRYA
jgi:hypothetical protein